MSGLPVYFISFSIKPRQNKTKMNHFLFGIPQGSILVPLLFNIFICDMFYFTVNFEIANYADDSTPFSTKIDGRLVVDELEISSSILFTWLKNSYMNANTGKSHLLLSGKNNLTANIDGNIIESKDNQFYLV